MPFSFVVAVNVLVLFALQDAVLTALRLSPFVPLENISTGALRVALVPVLLALSAANALTLAWVIPAALAVIVAVFPADERDKAVGAWTAWGGIGTVLGPLVGGQLVDAASWRWIFAINLPIVIGTLLLILRVVPQTRETADRSRIGGFFIADQLREKNTRALFDGIIKANPSSGTDGMIANYYKACLNTDAIDRAAGCELHNQERHEQNSEQGRNHQENAACDIGAHDYFAELSFAALAASYHHSVRSPMPEE